MRPSALLLASSLLACAPDGAKSGATRDTLVVYSAASLAAPVREAADSFASRTGAVVQIEHGGSLDLARRITELHRVPDVILLADHEVFGEVLMPGATSWYAQFARNRMVIAYTARSRRAAEAQSKDWRTLLMHDDVLVGRPDPAMAPAGYRALIVFELAEAFYRDAGLAARLAARSPPAQQRGNAAELAALLSAGELDYIIEYESLARAHGFRMIPLPPEIDLGDARHAERYATGIVRVTTQRDSVVRRGAPIQYALSVPRTAPHPEVGARFAGMLLGPEGQAMLRRAHVDAMDQPVFVGESVPRALKRTSP